MRRKADGGCDRVLELVLNRTEMVEVVMAINTLGAMAVPINVRLTPPEIAYIVDDADADVLIVDEPLRPLARAVSGITDRIEQRRRAVRFASSVGGRPRPARRCSARWPRRSRMP